MRLRLSAIGFCGRRYFVRGSFFSRSTVMCPVMHRSVPRGRLLVSTTRLRRTVRRGIRRSHHIPRAVIGGGMASDSVLRISLRVARLLSGAGKLDGTSVLSCRLRGFRRILTGCTTGGKRGVIFVRNGNSKMLHGTVRGRLGAGCGRCCCRSTSFHRCNFKTAVMAVG